MTYIEQGHQIYNAFAQFFFIFDWWNFEYIKYSE